MSNQSALNQLKTLIKAIRDEAYQAGYNDAMEKVKEVVFIKGYAPTVEVAPVRHKARRKRAEHAPAGHNKDVIIQVLRNASSRGLIQAEIRRHAAGLGERLAQSSTRHALSQLQEAGRVRQSGMRWQLVPQDEETAGTHAGQPAVPSTPNQGGQHAAPLV